jgi:ABC-type transport system substrate-binding protein
MVQPKDYIETNGEDYVIANPVGSGPYRLYDYQEGVHITYEAVEDHWRVGTPEYDYLTFYPMTETSARTAALQAGEADIVRADVSAMNSLEAEGFIPQMKSEGVFISLIPWWPFTEGNPIGIAEVRQALWYAVDKAAIVETVMSGVGEVVGSSMSMMTWAIEYKEYEPTPYDPATAEQLLEDAGYPDGFTIYLYPAETNLPEAGVVAEAVAGYWEAVGLDVQIIDSPFATVKPIYMNEQEPPGPAVFIAQMPNRPVYSWRGMYHSTALYSHTRDAVMDDLIETFEAATTQQEYIDRARDCMDYVLQEHYTTSLFVTDMIFMMASEVPQWDMGRGIASYRWEYIGK